MLSPVSIWSPIFSSNIGTDLPLLTWTLAVDGKQLPDEDDGEEEEGGTIKQWYVH